MLVHMPRVGKHDLFEHEYRAELKRRLSPYGLLIQYEEDRARLDLGLHLYENRTEGEDADVGTVRVWFQAKGIEGTTLSVDAFQSSAHVAVPGLPIETVRYWYSLPEPVYLVVYVESIDDFCAEDVRDIVEREGGVAVLGKLSGTTQKTMTLHVRSDATLDLALERMPRHRSLRVDGPHFRGRPLGHRYDPLRSELAPLIPTDFEALIWRLLDVHDFRRTREVDVRGRLDGEIGQVTAALGTLYLTYEWVSPLFTEFGVDPGTDFRIEAPPEYAHGEVLVVVHSDAAGVPRPHPSLSEQVASLEYEGIRRALVFFNDSELGNSQLFGAWRLLLEPLAVMPQGLGSIAFNVLTATTVYIEFLEKLRWRYVNYL